MLNNMNNELYPIPLPFTPSVGVYFLAYLSETSMDFPAFRRMGEKTSENAIALNPSPPYLLIEHALSGPEPPFRAFRHVKTPR
ncbi:MAG: hypothetical protein V1708_03035 [Candidatus Micrarchaeota archaeon]